MVHFSFFFMGIHLLFGIIPDKGLHVRFFDAKKANQKSRRPRVLGVRFGALPLMAEPKARHVLFSFSVAAKEKRTKRESRCLRTNNLPGK
jgi:hypothetical protein